jgi:DMSO/TMAO reductase YedYZ molybdopterin-dependent catalytic subunit
MERRHFLIGAAAGGIGLFQYAFFTGWMNQLRATRPRLRVKDYLQHGENAALAAITPVADFYNVRKGFPESIDEADWRLRIDGLVRRPIEYTLADIQKRPAVERVMTMECVENRIGGYLIGNARWKGTPLAPLLAEAGIDPRARHAAFHGNDRFSSGHPLERVNAAVWSKGDLGLDGADVILAYEMNGAPLTHAHGFPLRVLVPGKFGMKQPKWLTRIELLDRHYIGYWEERGWSDACERGIHARFDAPEDLARLQGRSFLLTGYALGGRVGVKGVEISTDDGAPWQTADLFSNPINEAWAFWRWTWNPAPGVYKLRLRGTARDGEVQSVGPTTPFPDGATGQQVVKVEVT